MEVVFIENKKHLKISVLGYEFDLSQNIDEFDANWLTVKFDYFDDEQSSSFTDNCLLANELENLSTDIKNVINGNETGIISDFLEPYFKFSLTKAGDIYAVQVRFDYDSENWKEIYICQGMNKKEICNLCNDLQKLSKNFPFRKTELQKDI